tara:strand:- start:253 stop:1329 length:1077 start_codon:yes stop_codon:yes gene_type:complete
MAYQALGLGSSANDGTGDDLRTGGDKINDNFVEIYTKLGNGSTLSSDTVALLTATQTLTNKTLTAPTVSGLSLSDSSIVIEGSSADANETTLTVTNPTADRTITLPDATGTVSLVGAAETLVGKTLTEPKFADAGFIADSNGNEQVIFQETASAVNEIEITNAATGGAASAGASTAPIIGASGETNVDLALLPKGTGHVAVRSTGGTNNQGAIRLNCENNTHGQTLMSQPHSAGDSGFFMLPKDGGSARATPNPLLSGAKTVGTTEAVNSATALSLNTMISELTTAGSGLAMTLANGVVGQVKIITMVVDGGGTATLTPATFANGTTIAFDAVNETVMLVYANTIGWVVVSNSGATVA